MQWIASCLRRISGDLFSRTTQLEVAGLAGHASSPELASGQRRAEDWFHHVSLAEET